MHFGRNRLNLRFNFGTITQNLKTMLIAPFTIIVDTREKIPYSFYDVYIGRKKAFALTSIGTLSTGDYSIQGFETKICVERKSLEDLYHTLIHDRERFIHELERMQDLERSLVVIEGTWQQIADPERFDPTWHSSAHPNSIIGSIVTFSSQFPTLWKAAGNRANGQKETFKFLLRYYNDIEKESDGGSMDEDKDGDT
jgi:ERCC4-type nuclease